MWNEKLQTGTKTMMKEKKKKRKLSQSTVWDRQINGTMRFERDLNIKFRSSSSWSGKKRRLTGLEGKLSRHVSAKVKSTKAVKFAIQASDCQVWEKK